MVLLSILRLRSHDRGEYEVRQRKPASKSQATSSTQIFGGTPWHRWQCIWVHWETCRSNSCGSNEIWSNYSMPTSSRCLLGIMKMCSLCRLCGVAPALCPAWPGPVRLTPSNPRNHRIAESPNRRGAHFDRITNREALPRDSARFGQPWSGWLVATPRLCIKLAPSAVITQLEELFVPCLSSVADTDSRPRRYFLRSRCHHDPSHAHCSLLRLPLGIWKVGMCYIT